MSLYENVSKTARHNVVDAEHCMPCMNCSCSQYLISILSMSSMAPLALHWQISAQSNCKFLTHFLAKSHIALGRIAEASVNTALAMLLDHVSGVAVGFTCPALEISCHGSGQALLNKDLP